MARRETPMIHRLKKHGATLINKSDLFQRRLAIGSILVFAIVGVVLLVGSRAASRAISYGAAEDSYVDNSLPEDSLYLKNGKENNQLWASQQDGPCSGFPCSGKTRSSYIKYNLAPLLKSKSEKGYRITSAKLRLYVARANGTGATVYKVDNNWSESTLSYQNAPPHTTAPIASINAPQSGRWVDVLLPLSAITADGTYSFKITSNDQNPIIFSSSESKNGPKLVITYDVPTTTPTTVKINWPENGASESGTTGLIADTAGSLKVLRVEFYLNANKLAEVTAGGTHFTYDWNTTTVPNATYILTAKAYDSGGNVATSPPVTVTINNGSTTPPPPPPPPPVENTGLQRGVYKPQENEEAWREWETLMGSPVQIAKHHIARRDWNQWLNPHWLFSERRRVAVNLGPAVEGIGYRHEKAAAGEYDSYHRQLADKFIANGHSNAIICLAWEFNGDWFEHTAAPRALSWTGLPDDPDRHTKFIAMWRHIHDVWMSRPGANFKWCWNMASTQGNYMDPALAYPGNAYVDYIGYNFYDLDYEITRSQGGNWAERRWNKFLATTNGLNWLASYASSKGKPIAFPEWGLVCGCSPSSGWAFAGGDDNAYFMTEFIKWMKSHNVAFETYHEVNNPEAYHNIEWSQFPNSKRIFTQGLGF